jgi:membrane protease YdiL (CAAX protease family)
LSRFVRPFAWLRLSLRYNCATPEEGSSGTKDWLFAGYGLLALFIIAAAGAIWGALVLTNLKTAASFPWCFPALLVVLWVLWRYLGGWGWPQSTAEKRRRLRRANPVSGAAFGWTALTGALAITALAGIWIVFFQLFRVPPNRLLPANFASSPLFAAAIIAGASLLAPITEESAIRGYLQTVLEREFTPVTAVILSSVVFAIAHVSQGAAWPKLLVYFLVGLTFGTLAYLNNSILPVIPVHIAGDVTFFLLVWPNDATRKLVSEGGADTWFWLHVAQGIVFGLLTVAALMQLKRVQGANAERQRSVAANRT